MPSKFPEESVHSMQVFNYASPYKFVIIVLEIINYKILLIVRCIIMLVSLPSIEFSG